MAASSFSLGIACTSTILSESFERPPATQTLLCRTGIIPYRASEPYRRFSELPLIQTRILCVSRSATKEREIKTASTTGANCGDLQHRTQLPLPALIFSPIQDRASASAANKWPRHNIP